VHLPREQRILQIKEYNPHKGRCAKLSEAGIDAQFTLMNAWPARGERLCMARATSSFPVPVSPVISTVESVETTFTILESTAQAGLIPRASIDSSSSSNFFKNRL
jgi:hypothetical protein